MLIYNMKAFCHDFIPRPNHVADDGEGEVQYTSREIHDLLIGKYTIVYFQHKRCCDLKLSNLIT